MMHNSYQRRGTMPALRRALSVLVTQPTQQQQQQQHPSGARAIVQSSGSGNLRSPLDAVRDKELAQKLRANGRGNYYRHQQKLWPNEEALERAMTEDLYSSVERTPLQMLPQPKRQRAAPRRIATCEGPGGTALLEREMEAQQQLSQAQLARATAKDGITAGVSPLREEEDDGGLLMDELLAMQQQHGSRPISDKIITERDLAGSVLASARERARDAILNDLAQNELMPCLDSQGRNTATTTDAAATAWGEKAAFHQSPPSARDAAGATWSSLGLDPLMARLAVEQYGPAPSRLQSRLLPALLSEDHNDVLFNGVTGSGKSTAMVLAMLQGIRSESAGMNVFIASSTTTAMRAHDAVRALCRRGGNVGGQLVDRPAEDFAWLILATYREDYEKYYQTLQRGLRGRHGPARLLITTADVLCELLFEKKMEFENFGYLRRVYCDDIGAQLPMLGETAPVEVVRERLRNPLAAELLLGTLHQLPGPHVRSLLQLGLVSADLDGQLKDHLTKLCLKPTAHTTVLSPVRVPSTVHCLFSFFGQQHKEDRWAYLARLIWNARATIPGRGVIFIDDSLDILQVRRRLRAHGMDAKIFSEVYGNGAFQEDSWKFLLLRESEAFGLDVPLVSHVFVTFAPKTWQSYLHMAGRTGRLGNVGWVYTVTDKREARHVRGIADDLAVDFVNHVVDADLAAVPAAEMDRLTREASPYGMDPQYAVSQHYEMQAENPEAAYRKREFFTRPDAIKQFQMENYTPIPEQHRRFENARRLARDVERDPRIAFDLAKGGLIDDKMRPTKKLRDQLNHKNSKHAPSPFEK